MTIQFHRLTVPTYAGGLPSGYDYINNAVSGTPAPVSPVLAGGPNIGSYLVGFGDDGTSANANRPSVALAANTDYLDNLLHRDIALPVVSSTAAGGVGATSIVLPAATFLGLAGTTNDAAGLKPYFHVTDDADNDIIDPSTGFPVVVSSLTITLPDVIGGGFSQNTVTAVFSEAIPTGRNYRVYYSTRGNLATLPQDAFTVIRIRGTQEVPAETEDLFRRLHGNSLAWDAPWTSTIWDLSLSGLDERYNRATVADSALPTGWPVALTNDTAGSGAWFNRTGPGLTGYSKYNYLGQIGNAAHPIGWMAGAFFVGIQQDVAGTNTFGAGSRTGGETTGFYFLGHQRYTQTVAESSVSAIPGFAAFYHGSSVEVGGTADTDFRTWLPAGSQLSFSSNDQPDVIGGWAALSGTPLRTAIACGYDMVEIDLGDGIKRQYVITAVNTTTNITIANKDGSNPDLNKALGTVVRWIRTTSGSFENSAIYRKSSNVGSDGGVQLQGFLYAVPPPMSTVGGDNNAFTPIAASFFGPDLLNTYVVVQWGGYDNATLTYLQKGALYADGSGLFDGTLSVGVDALIGGDITGGGILDITGNGDSTILGTLAVSSYLISTGTYIGGASYRAVGTSSTGSTSPFALSLLAKQALQIITPSGSGVLTVNVTGCSVGTGINGFAEFSFSIKQTTATFTSVVVTCDAGVTVHFEPSTLDATLSGANSTDIYRGTIIGSNCFMSVQRFPGV